MGALDILVKEPDMTEANNKQLFYDYHIIQGCSTSSVPETLEFSGQMVMSLFLRTAWASFHISPSQNTSLHLCADS